MANDCTKNRYLTRSVIADMNEITIIKTLMDIFLTFTSFVT